MFIRQRIYFEKDTGTIVQITGNFTDSGLYNEPTIEEDFQNYKALTERVPNTIGVITLEQDQYKDEMSRATGVRVDVKIGQLVFDYTPFVEKEIEKEKSIEQRVSLVEETLNEFILGGM
ncbi:hypothetical protein EXW32_27775 (plasmid) [Bacillus mycoides]|uniref:hypothetical protein n=1 Tax=Bacillus mycoides TaxID=1405 RepID=UPI001C018FFE|nr:hypothetical protein [Bacillus mycoides]QWG70191.1 hypothetical protein EXW32_27775 [Bacillus mycoides]